MTQLSKRPNQTTQGFTVLLRVVLGHEMIIPPFGYRRQQRRHFHPTGHGHGLDRIGNVRHRAILHKIIGTAFQRCHQGRRQGMAQRSARPCRVQYIPCITVDAEPIRPTFHRCKKRFGAVPQSAIGPGYVGNIARLTIRHEPFGSFRQGLKERRRRGRQRPKPCGRHLGDCHDARANRPGWQSP